MIDHLLTFPDELTARADPVVGKYWIAPSNDGPGAWRGDVCIPNVSVYAIVNNVRQDYAGWFTVIALPALDPALRDLPNNACRLIADRNAVERGDPNFILYTASDLDPATLSVAHVEPTFAGSNYPFGGNP